MIENFSKHIHRALKKRSGKVFYSGRVAFSGERPLYILGYNPGEEADAEAAETVGSHTRKVLGEKSQNWSAYRDESWKARPPGTLPMQRRVLHLLHRLALDPGEVPASNLIFVRSSSVGDIPSEERKCLQELCWPFHQAVIDQLGVRFILCLGEDAAKFVKKKTGAKNQVDQFIETNNRHWKNLCFANDEGLKVIQVTHPSRADWTNPNADPSDLVKRALQS